MKGLLTKALPASLLTSLMLAVPAQATDAKPPARVITLAPHITEMVFAAGAGPALAGTVISSDYPDAARALPKVGDGATSVNAEALLRLEPDLVLAWHPSGAVTALDPLLRNLHIPLVYVAPSHLDDIPKQIRQLGARLGTSAQADATAASLQASLTTLRRDYMARPVVRVFMEVGHTPLYAAGNDPMLNDALRTCGGTNVFADSPLAALPIGPENVLQKRPDVILVAQSGARREQQAKQRWASLGLGSAAGTQLYAIDPDTLFRPGPRMIDATRHLCQLLEHARAAPEH